MSNSTIDDVVSDAVRFPSGNTHNKQTGHTSKQSNKAFTKKSNTTLFIDIQIVIMHKSTSSTDVVVDGAPDKATTDQQQWRSTCQRLSPLFYALILIQFIVSFALFTTMMATHQHLLFLCGGSEFIVFFLLFLLILLGIALSLHCIFSGKKRNDVAADMGERLKLTAPDEASVNGESAIMKGLRLKLLIVRGFIITVSVVCTVLLVVFAIVYLGLTQSAIPRYSGTFVVKDRSLTAPVTIQREKSGVIHVIGRKKVDVAFGQGFAVAQDRLWQMEFNRRVAKGQLSQVVGKGALDIDKYMRTMGFGRLAEQDVKDGIFSPEIVPILQRFVDGVNAYIDSRPSSYRLAPEFGIFNYRPKPFEIVDVVLNAKLLSHDLSTNLKYELNRFKALRNGVSLERVEELMPQASSSLTITSKRELGIESTEAEDEELEKAFNDNSGAYIPTPDSARKLNDDDNRNNFKQMYSALYRQIFKTDHTDVFASNNWVVSGDLMANGKGFCANDPHLVVASPGIWVLVHLKTTHEDDNWDAIGATLPSIPNIIIGKNQNICWGVTNSMPDVQDLYVIDEINGQYQHSSGLLDIEERDEVIKVKGEADVTLKVRNTIYGPIVNDLYEEKLGHEKPVALKWTSLLPHDTTASAIIPLLQKRNWTEFIESFKDYVSPTQNFVYADTHGNIGYFTPGKIPIRERGHSGMFPVIGNGTYDWQGYIPFDSLPQVYNPEKGYIVSANNRVQPVGYPYNFGRDFAPIHRAKRISDMIVDIVNQNRNITVSDMKNVQLDVKSLLYEDIKDIFKKLEGYVSGKYETWRSRMERWNGIESAGSSYASVFEAFVYHSSDLFKEELGWEYSDDALLVTTLSGASDPILLRKVANLFVKAVKAVSGTNGVKAWGEQVHALQADHAILGKSALKCIANRRVFLPGGSGTVAVAPPRTKELTATHIASYRHLINFGDEDQFIIPGGQSGNMFSFYYDNLLARFSKGQYLSMRTHGYYVYRKMTIKR